MPVAPGNTPLQTVVAAYTDFYTGDMPQQNRNSDLKSQNADYGCRGCTVHKTERENLKLRHCREWSVYSEDQRARKHLMSLPTAKAQENFAKSIGMAIDSPLLLKISPALDIIATRPADPAHSEFNGVTDLVHRLLLDVMTDDAKEHY